MTGSLTKMCNFLSPTLLKIALKIIERALLWNYHFHEMENELENDTENSTNDKEEIFTFQEFLGCYEYLEKLSGTFQPPNGWTFSNFEISILRTMFDSFVESHPSNSDSTNSEYYVGLTITELFECSQILEKSSTVTKMSEIWKHGILPVINRASPSKKATITWEIFCDICYNIVKDLKVFPTLMSSTMLLQIEPDLGRFKPAPQFSPRSSLRLPSVPADLLKPNVAAIPFNFDARSDIRSPVSSTKSSPRKLESSDDKGWEMDWEKFLSKVSWDRQIVEEVMKLKQKLLEQGKKLVEFHAIQIEKDKERLHLRHQLDQLEVFMTSY